MECVDSFYGGRGLHLIIDARPAISVAEPQVRVLPVGGHRAPVRHRETGVLSSEPDALVAVEWR